MAQNPSFAPDLELADTSRRDARFARIESHYWERYRRLDQSGEGCYRLTCLGAWAASIPKHVYHFFRELRLERHQLFVDLGSGDGLVACIAALFTRAVGIEIDRRLCHEARQAIEKLDLSERAAVVCGDYLTQRIQQADCLYIYPDKPLDDLERMLNDWPGWLLVAGPHFLMSSLVPVRKLTCGRDELVVYRTREAAREGQG
jgi:hypothetical protein